MNILKEKNAVLNEQSKVRIELGRQNRTQEAYIERLVKQVSAIDLDNNTQDARIMQL